MGRHYIVNVEGFADKQGSVDLEVAGVIGIKGIMGVEGSAMLKGSYRSSVMHLRLLEGPPMLTSSSVACGGGGTACLGLRTIICVWDSVARELMVNMVIGLGVAKGRRWVGGTRGLLARPPTRAAVFMLNAAMMFLLGAELRTPASPARLRACSLRLLGLRERRSARAMGRSPITYVLLSGYTFLPRESSAELATTYRRLTLRLTLRLRRRPGCGVPWGCTQELLFCNRKSAGAMKTLQFEGELPRLGRAVFPS